MCRVCLAKVGLADGVAVVAVVVIVGPTAAVEDYLRLGSLVTFTLVVVLVLRHIEVLLVVLEMVKKGKMVEVKTKLIITFD